MTQKLFGTDGIRGRTNEGKMVPETMLKVAMATAARLKKDGASHGVVIGKDTRLSGYMLQPALTAGFVSMGLDVIQVGPLPTPAVAMLVRSLRADMGVMISASHNPFDDNGIKLFGSDGYKLSDANERDIEKHVAEYEKLELAKPERLGRVRNLEDAQGRYIEFAKNSFPKGMRLDGLRIVIDCAHGAAYKVAPSVLWELGADVIPIGVDPNGLNINHKCGATHIDSLRVAVLEHGADVGIALDGDADRLIMVDEAGNTINGDQTMTAIACHWKESGRLNKDTVVATVMSNLGMERYLESKGIKLERTPVGDKHVVEAMRKKGYSLGGEQSGHVILSDYATTGDGLISALQMLALLVEKNQPLQRVAQLYEPMPQALENVKLNGHNAPLEEQSVKDAIAASEQELGNKGRIVIRPSGTEPVIRVMAEGESPELIHRAVDRIVNSINSIG